MQRFVETVEIGASPERVWQALTRPDEVVRWDTGVVEPLDAPPDYPRPGQHVRWRYRLGPLPLLLRDRPTRVERASVLRSSIRLGPFDFDEIYTLRAAGPSSTALTADLSLTSRVPLLGRLLEWSVGRPLARSTVRGSLAALKSHCEGDRQPPSP
jgi:Polyketide cyclase / dehydrase and lipid transport